MSCMFTPCVPSQLQSPSAVCPLPCNVATPSQNAKQAQHGFVVSVTVGEAQDAQLKTALTFASLNALFSGASKVQVFVGALPVTSPLVRRMPFLAVCSVGLHGLSYVFGMWQKTTPYTLPRRPPHLDMWFLARITVPKKATIYMGNSTII